MTLCGEWLCRTSLIPVAGFKKHENIRQEAYLGRGSNTFCSIPGCSGESFPIPKITHLYFVIIILINHLLNDYTHALKEVLKNVILFPILNLTHSYI